MGTGASEGTCSRLQKPSKKLDPSYSGEYDFLLDGGIKIEVKASRAVDFDSDEPLYVKALASDSTAIRHELSAGETRLLRRFRLDRRLARCHPALGVGLQGNGIESVLLHGTTPRGTRARGNSTSNTTFASLQRMKSRSTNLPLPSAKLTKGRILVTDDIGKREVPISRNTR